MLDFHFYSEFLKKCFRTKCSYSNKDKMHPFKIKRTLFVFSLLLFEGGGLHFDPQLTFDCTVILYV